MGNYFNTNLKHLRIAAGLTQEDLGKRMDKDYSTIGKWENGTRSPIMEDVLKVSELFNIELTDLLLKDLRFDNAEFVDISSDTVQIPVLGTIKAGIAIEAQQDILEYIDIPKNWIKGGKTFYGLKISGDSMYPKYQEKDIVIFEHTSDYTIANKKDCAVMVNGFDATFKNITITDSGIHLVPLNPNNSDNYQPTFFSNEEIAQLPVKIVGIAREKRTKID